MSTLKQLRGKPYPFVNACALCLVLASGVPARSAPPTPRERELEDLVRTLSQRVEQLEQRVKTLEGKPAEKPTVAAGTTEAVVEGSTRQAPGTESGDASSASLTDAETKRLKQWLDDPMTMRSYWKDALTFETADKSFKLKIGGRLHWDTAYFSERNIGRRIAEFNNNTEMRRARLYISGHLYDNIDFKTQYDFAGGDANFKDVYVGVKKVPVVGNLRFGQFKEPFSLEEQGSSNYITFPERSLVSTFSPGRNTGVMAFDSMADERMTWAVGVFRQTDDSSRGVTGGRDYDVTGRLTALPVYRDDGRELVHVGVAYSHQNCEDHMFRYSARPESHLAPHLVDTGMLPVDHGDLIGVELLWIDGPFSLQSEYVHSWLDGRNRWVGDPSFWGASVHASYIVTGEHRPYSKKSGTFARLRPKRDFDGKGGGGAWEVAARYSYLTLNDEHVHGGRLDDISLGLNWYWNPNLRMMWNYVFADPSKGGDASILQWRVQLAF